MEISGGPWVRRPRWFGVVESSSPPASFGDFRRIDPDSEGGGEAGALPAPAPAKPQLCVAGTRFHVGDRVGQGAFVLDRGGHVQAPQTNPGAPRLLLGGLAGLDFVGAVARGVVD